MSVPDFETGRRREPRNRLPRRGRGTPDVRVYEDRIADLETDRTALRGQLRRLKGRAARGQPDAADPEAATETVREQPTSVAAATEVQTDPNAPRDLESAARLLTDLEKKKETEHEVPANETAVNEAYRLLSQGTYANADPETAKGLYERLSFLQRYEFADDAQRQQWLVAAKSRIEPFVPSKPAQIQPIIDQINALREQESGLGNASSRTLDGKLMNAYRSLGTSFDCTPAEARALRTKIEELQSRELQPTGPRWQVYKARQGLLKTTHDALTAVIDKNAGNTLWARFLKMFKRTPTDPPQTAAA